MFTKINSIGLLGLNAFHIDVEIEVLREMGVTFKTGVEVGKDITLDQLRSEGFEAFYLAIGAQGGRLAGIPGEDADGVAASADAGDDFVGQPSDLVEALPTGFLADAALEVFDDRRVRVRTGRGAEQIERVGDVRGPVPQGIIDRVLERARPAFDRDDLRAAELHLVDVDALALDVDGAHEDLGLHAQQRADHRGGQAMLACAGLGDQLGLAHVLGEQTLAQRVVDLVRAAVEQARAQVARLLLKTQTDRAMKLHRLSN